jgi:hypothetical protein
MLFEEIDTEESSDLQSDVSSLDDGLSRMQFGSSSSEEQFTDDDDDVHSEVWDEIEPESDGEFTEDYGMMEELPANSRNNTINPIDCYRYFITDEIIGLMVRETNRYAEQHMETQKLTKRSKTLQWKPTTNEEMFKFLGIIIEMGLVQMPEIDYYWSKSKLFGCEVIQNTMSRDRFELLLKFYHFSNNRDKHLDQDRLFKLRPLLDLLRSRFKSIYIPGSTISIDETMVPWKGRLLFKQYIPGKAHKYGVKVYKLAAVNGYTWNFTIYTGKRDPTSGAGHAQTIVMELADGLLGYHRTVVVDNFFTSISLAKCLLRNDTYLIGTLRSNRIGLWHEVLEKELKRGEVYGLQDNNGVKLIKWKDKRDVLMISTKPSHSATLVDTGKTNKANERIMKPQVIIDYNKGKRGIDLSDQLSAYYTCLRRSKKWYQKVAFEMIFGMSIVNAYLIYKENYDTRRTTMLQFRESLVRSLLLGVPYENLKPGPGERSTSQTKRKLADHKLEEMEGAARDVRRRCVVCYEKIRQQQSREATAIAAKRIKTFCPDCDKFFCLDCFNEKHFSK